MVQIILLLHQFGTIRNGESNFKPFSILEREILPINNQLVSNTWVSSRNFLGLKENFIRDSAFSSKWNILLTNSNIGSPLCGSLTKFKPNLFRFEQAHLAHLFDGLGF